jgi:hypothetical protein
MEHVALREVGPQKIWLNQAGTEAWHFCASSYTKRYD